MVRRYEILSFVYFFFSADRAGRYAPVAPAFPTPGEHTAGVARPCEASGDAQDGRRAHPDPRRPLAVDVRHHRRQIWALKDDGGAVGGVCVIPGLIHVACRLRAGLGHFFASCLLMVFTFCRCLCCVKQRRQVARDQNPPPPPLQTLLCIFCRVV